MAKPKKVEAEVIAYPPRYKSNYASWQDFVGAMVPADKYPAMRERYLR